MHPAQCREQQDAAIAILEVGRMNDGVQQQTQRAEFPSAIAPEFWTERANWSSVKNSEAIDRSR
jgi:hypothetical protein